MSTSCNVHKDKDGKLVDERKYQCIIEFLIYLLTSSHLDIVFVVYLCAHFQEYPNESHFTMVKCIMKYLTNIPLIGLWYLKGNDCTLLVTLVLILLSEN